MVASRLKGCFLAYVSAVRFSVKVRPGRRASSVLKQRSCGKKLPRAYNIEVVVDMVGLVVTVDIRAQHHDHHDDAPSIIHSSIKRKLS